MLLKYEYSDQGTQIRLSIANLDLPRGPKVRHKLLIAWKATDETVL